jgi:kinesin family protein 11
MLMYWALIWAHKLLKNAYFFRFVSSERKDKIETGNKELVQTFRIQLTQQLEVLHKTVEGSVSQQQWQLQTMEDQMQSFVSTKTEVGETLS